MDWTVWLMFTLTEGALIVTPGPAVLLVVSQGLRCGSAGALWSAVGILASNALYFAVSGTGVGAMLAASSRLFTAVKWAGAGYLLYLGAMALIRPRPLHGIGRAPNGPGSERRTLFLRGLVLQLTNPKALLFFVAILPQFINRERPILFQLLVLGITSIVLEFVVLAVYGAAAARAARVIMQPRFATVTSRLSGALLVGAALGLLRIKT
ncbi:MAG TPA: LysE family translocator [Candidatus Polarisedimenticolia bacterium]|nr:LysE family translocator [Candidatus Polarisedimenticolia bacterium]